MRRGITIITALSFLSLTTGLASTGAVAFAAHKRPTSHRPANAHKRAAGHKRVSAASLSENAAQDAVDAYATALGGAQDPAKVGTFAGASTQWCSRRSRTSFLCQFDVEFVQVDPIGCAAYARAFTVAGSSRVRVAGEPSTLDCVDESSGAVPVPK
jgi:hypothetical protein